MSYSPFKLLCLGTNKPAHRFEAQLTAVKERLEAAKQGSTRGLGPTPAGGNNFGNNPFGRIAKPLRGGGAPAGERTVGMVREGGNMVPTFAGLRQQSGQSQEGGAQEGAAGGKRGSWFFNQRT